MVKSLTNIEKIVKLFEKPKFRKYSFEFYKKETSFTDIVEKYSGEISRQTINNHFKTFRRKDKSLDPQYIQTIAAGRKNKHKFKTQLVVDWLKEIGELTKEETKWLLKSLKRKEINSFLREIPDSWADFCNNLAVSWSFGLYSFEKGELEKRIKFNEIYQSEEEFEDENVQDNLDYFENKIGSSSEDEKISDMMNLMSFFLPAIKENPGIAERVFEKLKEKSFPFDKNPFENAGMLPMALKLMEDMPLMDLLEETLINNNKK